MKVVLAAATENEIAPTKEWLKQSLQPVNLLVTGVGSAMTAYSLTRYILQEQPTLVIQAGIGGSFSDKFPPGSVAIIDRELFADLGAIDSNELTDIFDLGLADSNGLPFKNKWLSNPHAAYWKKLNLPFASSATVNNISSSQLQADRIKRKYNPDIEAMEGAALHYVCLKENVPFVQLRSVSNYAGERNKLNWRMPEAIQVLNEHLKILMQHL